MTIIAAAIVAMAARPRQRGEVVQHLLSSTLSAESDDFQSDSPSVEFQCRHDGTVGLVRRGIEGVSMSGAVSLAVSTNGVDVSMEERLVEGSSWDAQAVEARFNIDFMPPGWYHVKYNSEKTGLFAAFQLHVRPGLCATRLLNR